MRNGTVDLSKCCIGGVTIFCITGVFTLGSVALCSGGFCTSTLGSDVFVGTGCSGEEGCVDGASCSIFTGSGIFTCRLSKVAIC